jgi:hypothetical protein
VALPRLKHRWRHIACQARVEATTIARPDDRVHNLFYIVYKDDIARRRAPRPQPTLLRAIRRSQSLRLRAVLAHAVRCLIESRARGWAAAVARLRRPIGIDALGWGGRAWGGVVVPRRPRRLGPEAVLQLRQRRAQIHQEPGSE